MYQPAPDRRLQTLLGDSGSSAGAHHTVRRTPVNSLPEPNPNLARGRTKNSRSGSQDDEAAGFRNCLISSGGFRQRVLTQKLQVILLTPRELSTFRAAPRRDSKKKARHHRPRQPPASMLFEGCQGIIVKIC
jgi:hypothetical protein